MQNNNAYNLNNDILNYNSNNSNINIYTNNYNNSNNNNNNNNNSYNNNNYNNNNSNSNSNNENNNNKRILEHEKEINNIIDNSNTSKKLKIDKGEFFFFKVWRNNSILKLIYKHARLFRNVNVSTIAQLIKEPRKSYISKLAINSNEILEPKGVIPGYVSHLILSHCFDKPLRIGDIPESVVNFKLYNCGYSFYSTNQSFRLLNIVILELHGYNQIIQPGYFPESLTQLDLPHYNQPIKENVLPKNIKYLYLAGFNQILAVGSLPPNLISLFLGSDFDQVIFPFILPSTLETLEIISKQYNHQLIIDALPKSLKTFKLYTYKYPLIENQIPNSVINLELNHYWNSLKNIPNSVKNLSLYSFNQPIQIDEISNKSIEVLKFGFNYSYYYSINSVTLPPSCHTVIFTNPRIKSFIDYTILPLNINLKFG